MQQSTFMTVVNAFCCDDSPFARVLTSIPCSGGMYGLHRFVSIRKLFVHCSSSRPYSSSQKTRIVDIRSHFLFIPGTEPLLQLAPPLYVFIALFVCPLVYAMPSGCICVDVTSAYPVDGGMVAWIDMAFGSFIGGHNMYWFAAVGWQLYHCSVIVQEDRFQ